MPVYTYRRFLTADHGFLAALVALAALPLIGWNGSPLFFAVWPVVAVCGCWLVLLAVWLKTTPAAPAFSVPGGDSEQASSRTRMLVRPAIAVLLLMLTLVAFYLPLRINFWGGVDEFTCFQPRDSNVWSDTWDRGLGRPLVGMPAWIAKHLMPGRIEGFLWLAVFLCFGNAWLLFLLLGRLMPRATAIPTLAAILLIVHRADPLRFFIMWASNHYETVIFLLLLASWLFVLSYERQNRILLVLACVALSGALLSNESAYPSAALIPVLGLAVRREWKRYSVWAFAWYGTITLLATRLALFLLISRDASYQSGFLKELIRHPRALLLSLSDKLLPALIYFHRSASWRGYGSFVCAAFALAAVSVLAARRSLAGERITLRVIALTAVAILCGVLPFLPVNTALRTHFLVAPAEATMLALVIVLVARAFPARLGGIAAAVAAGLLAANATVAAIQTQQRHPSSVRFEHTVQLFRQIHGISPSFVPNTLLVFVLEDPDRSPLGFNYGIDPLARMILGVDANQANYHDPFHSVPRFTENRVVATDGRYEQVFRYEQVVAFRVKQDGSAVLLRQLPPELLPEPKVGSAYNPLARMRGGAFSELAYFRYPYWTLPPGDVVTPEDGLMLGDGWGPLIAEGRDAYRVAIDGAELVVNSQGANPRDLTLELEPRPGSQSDGCEIEVRDSSGAVVATAPLIGRALVHLAVPMEPEQVGLFRLYVRPPSGSATSAPAAGWARVRAYQRGDATCYAPLVHDIFRDGLIPGRGWHALEVENGENFHWAGSDAEIDLRFYLGSAPELALKVQAGPGCRGNSCTLEVRDESNDLLARRTFRTREELRVPVPPGYRGLLRLHSEGGGPVAGPDSRVLNYRVFACGAGSH
jgi:hypothetical protein